MRLKKKIYIYKCGDDIAITKAYSMEEARYKFEKQFAAVTGTMIEEAEFNHLDIACIKKYKIRD